MKFKALFLAPVMLMALTGCGPKEKNDQQLVNEMVALITNVNNPATGAGVEPGSTLRLKNSSTLLGVKTLVYETGKKNKDGSAVTVSPEIEWSFSDDKWKIQEYTPNDAYCILKPKLIYKAADEYSSDLTLKMTLNGVSATSVYHVSIYYV